MNLGAVDRTPVVAQVFGHSAGLLGVTLSEILQDGELLARGQLEALKRYGDDAVFGLMDLSVETQAVGSRVRFRDGAYPTVERYALKPGANLDTLALPNPRESGRMPELLKALRVFRRAVGDDVLVSGCVAGPMTLTTQLFGIETALYLAVDDPEGFERVLDFSVEVAQVFGRAQVEAGAHVVLVFDPSASPEVVPPALFRELLLPRFKKVFSALDDAGSRARWLSITGNRSIVEVDVTRVGGPGEPGLPRGPGPGSSPSGPALCRWKPETHGLCRQRSRDHPCPGSTVVRGAPRPGRIHPLVWV